MISQPVGRPTGASSRCRLAAASACGSWSWTRHGAPATPGSSGRPGGRPRVNAAFRSDGLFACLRVAACGGGRWVAVFVAEIQIEAHPLAVVGTLGCRHPHLVQPPLKGGPYLCGNRLPGSAFGSYHPPLGGCLGREDKPLEGGKLKPSSTEAFTAEPGRSKGGTDEANGFIGGRQPSAYHPKTGR